MGPPILIIESQHEVAAALEEVVNSANYQAMVLPYVDRLADIPVRPAAIVVRIAFESVSDPPHKAIARLPAGRPPIVAIAMTEEECTEAARLKCEVVLRGADGVKRLCNALSDVLVDRPDGDPSASPAPRVSGGPARGAAADLRAARPADE